jgi:hypothetical protein
MKSLARVVAIATALASAARPASPAAAERAFVAAMMSDAGVAACAGGAGKTAQAYVNEAFNLHHLTLRGGERMTVAVAKDGCMSLGQSSRVMIFERTVGGYRRVLDGVSLPDAVDAREDGTIVLPTHSTFETIFEAAYLWNGTTYAFSPLRSHVYDVPLDERKPYEVTVRFAPGAFATTLSGGVARNFGQRYVFYARAGQAMTLELINHAGRLPKIFLSLGERDLAVGGANGWTRKLPQSGLYALTALGADESDATVVSTYALRLSIR